MQRRYPHVRTAACTASGERVLEHRPSRGRACLTRPSRGALYPLCVVLVAVFVIVACAGCRPTDVLTELVYDQSAEVDESLPALRVESTDAEEQDELISDAQDETEKEDTQTQDEPVYDDETPTSDESTAQREQSDDSANTVTASEGVDPDASEEGEADGTVATAAEGANDDIAASADDVAMEGAGGDVAQDGTEEADEDSSGGGGLGGEGVVYDDGTYETLPSASCIAAVGQYAVIVQMLGGAGALAAADESTLASWEASGAFPGEYDGVVAAWEDDGSEAGTLDVQAAIDAGAECVLTSAVYGELATDEEAQLTAAGIDVVLMPTIGTVDAYDSQIVYAVRIVGEILKKAGGSIEYDANALASQYASLHDSVLSAVLKKNGGYSTWMKDGSTKAWLYYGTSVLSGPGTSNTSSTRYVLSYIDGWATAKTSTRTETRAGTTVTVDCSEGLGMYLAATKETGNVYATFDYYLQHAGVMDVLMCTQSYDYSSYADEALENLGEFNLPYISYGVGYNALRFNFLAGSSTCTVGGSTYPAVVVRTREYGELVRASADKGNGTYNVGTDYEVWVMPSGVSGSWVDGTVESFFVAPWAWCMYQNGKDLSLCGEYLDEFYKTFFRCGYEDALEGYGVVL